MKVFILITCVILASECYGAEFKIKNNGEEKLQIGIQGGKGHPHLENGGFELEGNQERIVQSPDDWEGRFWAATGCEDGVCETGGCGNKIECGGNGGSPPITLVEIKLNGNGDQDFYDISLADGFNVKASIKPSGGEGNCPSLDCNEDVNGDCPDNLKMIFFGNTVGCYSSCNIHNNDETCCRGAYNSAETCNPNKWEDNSAKYFKSKCPGAYSYAYDDAKSLSTCKASSYLVTFC